MSRPTDWAPRAGLLIEQRRSSIRSADASIQPDRGGSSVSTEWVGVMEAILRARAAVLLGLEREVAPDPLLAGAK